MTRPLLDVDGLSKAYGGLRPLRVGRLIVVPGERVAITGFDRPMGEVFVNLVTGASLPDRGTVGVFGHLTSAIADGTAWLKLIDRFGIVSDRVVLLDSLTVIQNLALPLTLDLEPPPPDVCAAAARLAEEVGLPAEIGGMPVGQLDGASRARVRLARAIALDPEVLLLEHPTATVEPEHVASFAARIREVSERRGTAVVAVTADTAFARSMGGRTIAFDAATGRPIDRDGGWFARIRR